MYAVPVRACINATIQTATKGPYTQQCDDATNDAQTLKLCIAPRRAAIKKRPQQQATTNSERVTTTHPPVSFAFGSDGTYNDNNLLFQQNSTLQGVHGASTLRSFAMRRW